MLRTDPSMQPERRALLRGASGWGALFALGPMPAWGATATRKQAVRYKDPVWNRDQSARLEAHNDGRQIFGRAVGTVNGVRPGEAVRVLLHFHVFSAIRVVRRADGHYDRMCRELIFYSDPESGEILDEWQNPYTGERVRVVDVANDPYNWVIRSWLGPPALPGVETRDIPEPLDANRKPFLLKWTDLDAETVVMQSGGHGYYRNHLDPARWPRESSGPMVQASELFRYFIRRADLENAALTHLPHQGVWIRIQPWLPWMLMGAAPGHVIYDGMFTGSDTLDWHPPEVVARVKKRFPNYLTAPDSWYGPSLSSLEHYAQEQKPAPPRAK